MGSERASLESLFAKVDPDLIGVWKFRERGQPPVWCATVIVDGTYFDVEGSPTIAGVLEKTIQEIENARDDDRS